MNVRISYLDPDDWDGESPFASLDVEEVRGDLAGAFAYRSDGVWSYIPWSRVRWVEADPARIEGT